MLKCYFLLQKLCQILDSWTFWKENDVDRKVVLQFNRNNCKILFITDLNLMYKLKIVQKFFLYMIVFFFRNIFIFLYYKSKNKVILCWTGTAYKKIFLILTQKLRVANKIICVVHTNTWHLIYFSKCFFLQFAHLLITGKH